MRARAKLPAFFLAFFLSQATIAADDTTASEKENRPAKDLASPAAVKVDGSVNPQAVPRSHVLAHFFLMYESVFKDELHLSDADAAIIRAYAAQEKASKRAARQNFDAQFKNFCDSEVSGLTAEQTYKRLTEIDQETVVDAAERRHSSMLDQLSTDGRRNFENFLSTRVAEGINYSAIDDSSEDFVLPADFNQRVQKKCESSQLANQYREKL